MAKLDRRRANPQPANLVAERVRRVRSERGLSQAECAEAVQGQLKALFPALEITIDQSDMSRLENGKRPVWDYELRALAAALSVSADYLLGLVETVIGD